LLARGGRRRRGSRLWPSPRARLSSTAKANGRWGAASAPIRSATQATIPDDLRASIAARPRARKTFRILGRQNLFALAFRTNNMKTPAGRARKIATLLVMLERGETIVPERRTPRAGLGGDLSEGTFRKKMPSTPYGSPGIFFGTRSKGGARLNCLGQRKVKGVTVRTYWGQT
jgi:hypothetical protein